MSDNKRLDNNRYDAQVSDLSPNKALAATREHASQSTQSNTSSSNRK